MEKMSDDSCKKRVFLSYAGKRGQEVAGSLEQLLEELFPSSLKTVYAPKLLHFGDQWFEKLIAEIVSVDIAVVCVTPESIISPWTHFEAGALLKALPRARIIPLGIQLSPDQLQPPLSAFHAVSGDQHGIAKLIRQISIDCGLPTKNPSDAPTWTTLLQKLESPELRCVGRDSPVHNRNLAFCQDIELAGTPLRRAIGLEILTEICNALDELRGGIRDGTFTDFLRMVQPQFDHADSLTHVKAVCGNKPYEKPAVKTYYDLNVELAARFTAQGASDDAVVTRIFIEPDRGYGPDCGPVWECLMRHHRASSRGMSARVIRKDTNSRTSLFAALAAQGELGRSLAEEILRGLGLVVFEHSVQQPIAFAHRGADEQGNFQYAQFTQRYTVAAIRHLFERMLPLSEEFNPRQFGGPEGEAQTGG